MDDRQALIDRLNANANSLLDGKQVKTLELVNAMVAAASMLGYSRPPEFTQDDIAQTV